MIWKEIEIRVRRGIYSHSLYWNVYLFPYEFKKSIYKKYSDDSYIRFEHIPENWLGLDYLFFFDKFKDLYYITDDDIKMFNFNLFKKNGFLFLLFCGLLFQNCFIEFIYLVLKSLFAFYVIVDLIYVILLIRKNIYFYIKFSHYFSANLAFIFFLNNINDNLNLYLKSKNKWYF